MHYLLRQTRGSVVPGCFKFPVGKFPGASEFQVRVRSCYSGYTGTGRHVQGAAATSRQVVLLVWGLRNSSHNNDVSSQRNQCVHTAGSGWYPGTGYRTRSGCPGTVQARA
eukprot:3231380-Rhodomonas_salina.2